MGINVSHTSNTSCSYDELKRKTLIEKKNVLENTDIGANTKPPMGNPVKAEDG